MNLMAHDRTLWRVKTSKLILDRLCSKVWSFWACELFIYPWLLFHQASSKASWQVPCHRLHGQASATFTCPIFMLSILKIMKSYQLDMLQNMFQSTSFLRIFVPPALPTHDPKSARDSWRDFASRCPGKKKADADLRLWRRELGLFTCVFRNCCTDVWSKHNVCRFSLQPTHWAPV